MKPLIEIIHTGKQENILSQITLRDIKIGQRFKFKKDGLIYVKDTEQGLNNDWSYCHTEKKIKTKGYGYLKERSVFKSQSCFIYEILPPL